MEKYIFLGLILYFTSYFFYIYFSHGIGHTAAYLQLRRFLPCAILAVLPIYLTLSPIISKPYLISMGIGLLWIVTYPLLYFFTYNKSSSDFGFHFDIVFGLYFIGWSISLKLLLNYFDFFHTFTIFILSLFEVTIFSIILFQWIYYSIYRTCINDNAIMLIRETDFNETIEFYKSLPLLIQMPILIALFSVLREPVTYGVFVDQAQFATAAKGFLWIKDLTTPDVILAVLSGATTFLMQTLMMPKDQQQGSMKMMTYVMSVSG